MVSKNVETIEDDGPTAYADLPTDSLSVNDRMNGLARLKITGRNGGGKSMGGSTRSIVYDFEDHDKREVVREFFDVNQKFVEECSYHKIRQLFANCGTGWGEAASAVMGERGLWRSNG